MATAKNQTQAGMDYHRIEAAIRYLDGGYRSQPSLEEVARHVHLSPFHFERLFTRWAGVSPKRYLQFLTREHARALLKNSASVAEAAYESGLSGPSRLHDLLVNCDGVTPGEMKRRGLGVSIACGVHQTPFGSCVIGVTAKGICSLQFIEPDGKTAIEELVLEDWPRAEVRRDDRTTQGTVDAIFARSGMSKPAGLRIFLRGTKFQLAVWQALLRVRPGAVTTYKAIAGSIGAAKACRAVGGAVGSNPIAYLIPCHRVLQASGEIGGYRWGVDRKRAILFREFARNNPG